jgi:hypothetical protein
MNSYEVTIMPPQAPSTFQRIHADSFHTLEADNSTKLTFYRSTKTQPVACICVPAKFSYLLLVKSADEV